jgi:NADPH:quinone reductase-like Zn-dependent oxidoreductase
VRAGEQLLVHGAGGVTGGLLVALAALRGAQVIATAGPGQLPVPVAASYPLADAAQALAEVTGGHAAGAIVLRPTP